MNIAANLSLLFTEQPLAERILAARVAGFDGVEIQFPYEVPAIVLKERLSMAEMPLVLINLPAADLLSGGPGLAAVPARQAEFDQALAEALTYAAMAQPKKVNVLPGRLAQGVSEAQALECLVANLAKAAAEFAHLGIKVVCEAINPLDMPGFLISTPEQLAELIERVDHPNLKAQLDLYHMARQGISAAHACLVLGKHIGHVQFADYPGRGAPGSGTLDFLNAWAALKHAGYSGWVAAEYLPGEQGTQASLDWLEHWRAKG